MTALKQEQISGDISSSLSRTLMTEQQSEAPPQHQHSRHLTTTTEVANALADLQQGCQTIDFNDIPAGTYVQNEWQATAGFTITAIPTSGGYTGPGNAGMGRLFDSANPMTETDLGSPNSGCGGPGKGSGGAPGKPGENCVALGNLLLIQHSDTPEGKDNSKGGKLVFDFGTASRKRIQSVTLLDNEKTATRNYVEATTIDGATHKFDSYVGEGNNAKTKVDMTRISADIVRTVEVSFLSQGAVAELEICDEITPAPVTPVPTTLAPITPAPVTNAPISFSPTPMCTKDVTIYQEDFEAQPFDMGGSGWVNAEIDSDPGFTQFMGRFDQEARRQRKYPFRTFLVPKDDKTGTDPLYVTLEADFYEIDACK